ncbi:MAG: hypothetical protein OEY78_01565, partial [Gammaproteobacteria bacterium]|nr:hypothetical protein [Gammaproteobacteria bacterium]
MNLISNINKLKKQLLRLLLLLGLSGLFCVNSFAIDSDVEDVIFDDKPLDYALMLPDWFKLSFL